MHFYKRELSPVREAFVNFEVISQGSPYKKNFEKYGVNL